MVNTEKELSSSSVLGERNNPLPHLKIELQQLKAMHELGFLLITKTGCSNLFHVDNV